MKKVLLSLMATVLLLASSATLVVAAPGDVTDSDYLKDLGAAGLAAAHATAKYQNVDKALADGFKATVDCLESKDGVTGRHFEDSGSGQDAIPSIPTVYRPETPEVLLYVPTDGGLRLVGVGYMAVYEGQPAPILFGQTFELMDKEHRSPEHPDYSGPAHYYLHVWLWEKNPAGIFADFNPNPDLSCQSQG